MNGCKFGTYFISYFNILLIKSNKINIFFVKSRCFTILLLYFPGSQLNYCSGIGGVSWTQYQNVDVQKADIQNVNIQNVNIQNVKIQNVDIQNVDVQNVVYCLNHSCSDCFNHFIILLFSFLLNVLYFFNQIDTRVVDVLSIFFVKMFCIKVDNKIVRN